MTPVLVLRAPEMRRNGDLVLAARVLLDDDAVELRGHVSSSTRRALAKTAANWAPSVKRLLSGIRLEGDWRAVSDFAGPVVDLARKVAARPELAVPEELENAAADYRALSGARGDAEREKSEREYAELEQGLAAGHPAATRRKWLLDLCHGLSTGKASPASVPEAAALCRCLRGDDGTGDADPIALNYDARECLRCDSPLAGELAMLGHRALAYRHYAGRFPQISPAEAGAILCQIRDGLLGPRYVGFPG